MTDTSVARQKASLASKLYRAATSPVTWIVFLGCAPLLALRFLPLLHLQAACDFMTYWSAGHLFVSAQNPYSASALLVTERMVGWPYDRVLMMFYPPWTLPVTAIFAIAPYREARLGWLVVSIFLDCISSIALWAYFGGERKRAWISLVFLATFVPMATAEYVGQITPLILICVVGFLWCARRKRYFAAGLLLLGFGLKPQLLYLIWIAIAFWVIQRRIWAIPAGAFVSYGASVIAARFYNPHAFTYLHNAWGPAIETLTGAGGLLRGIFGTRQVWLQFVPSIIGILWLITFWLKNRRRWKWEAQMPLLLLVSLCTAPFFWYHDFILVAPAMIFIAVKMKERLPLLIPGWLLVQCAILFCADVSAALEATAGVLWIGFYFYARTVRARDYPQQRVLESETTA